MNLTPAEQRSLNQARNRARGKFLPLLYLACGIAACLYIFRRANEFLSAVKMEQIDVNTLMLLKGGAWTLMGYLLVFMLSVGVFIIFGHPNDRLLVKLHDRITEIEEAIDKEKSSRT